MAKRTRASGTLREAVIAGVYQTAQGRLLDRGLTDLYFEAVKGAMDDAGVSIKEVDGMVGGNPLLTDRDGLGGSPAAAFTEHFNTRMRYSEQVRTGTQSEALGLLHAMDAVALGRAHTVIVPMAAGRQFGSGEGRDTGQQITHDEWLGPFGLPRVALHGMIARRHMHEYGTTSEQLARVAVIARKHAVLNPAAVMHSRGPLTVEDVLNSRRVYDPLHLLDCCLVSEGAAAVLVTTAERARDMKHASIRVLGYAESFDTMEPYGLPSLTTSGATWTGKETFAMAGVSHSDIDVAQISDHFTIGVIIELEDLGFCGKGEGGPFVESGAVELGGTMPINTNGGYLSHSHPHGVGLLDIIELVRQLRGEAGARQVPNARIGLFHGVGGTFETAQTAILAKD